METSEAPRGLPDSNPYLRFVETDLLFQNLITSAPGPPKTRAVCTKACQFRKTKPVITIGAMICAHLWRVLLACVHRREDNVTLAFTTAPAGTTALSRDIG